MGATAVISSSASSVSASAAGVSAAVTSLLSPVGTGVGGIAVAVVLVYVLAYLDVVSAHSGVSEQVKRTLVATALPLGITFLGIVLFRTLQLL